MTQPQQGQPKNSLQRLKKRIAERETINREIESGQLLAPKVCADSRFSLESCRHSIRHSNKVGMFSSSECHTVWNR